MGREVDRGRRPDDRESRRREFAVITARYRARLYGLTAEEKRLMCEDPPPLGRLREWAECARDDARPGIAEAAHGMLRALDGLERP